MESIRNQTTDRYIFAHYIFTNNGVSANTSSNNQQALSERSHNQNCNIDSNLCNFNLEFQHANRHNSSYFNLEFKYMFMLSFRIPF
ncbi:hypothetical protein CWI36_3391p0010 [Hamiltosporidium magnivora]|uniref:Uncharacterized protein n=1 Tax=Hamiltosporidium magnivora TaxID=148818 RepID=A0A4Q9KQ52_9MICR|nr:hypothetical protein CWI36_3391p0010 [Hamiltosporidium magnivora]